MEACHVLIDGVYQFPELPKNHGMTREEIDEYWDLPEELAACISTKGLIPTVLDYPNIYLILAGSNEQHGYTSLIYLRFRGARELESRPDRGTELLSKYKTIDPLGYSMDWEPVEVGSYQFRIIFLEIIFSQYANLEPLTVSEKTELVELARNYLIKKESSEIHGELGIASTSAVLLRLMKADDYAPFMEVYDPEGWAWRDIAL